MRTISIKGFLKSVICPMAVAACMSGAAVVALSSCKDDENKEAEIVLPEDYEENVPLPTTDQLEETYKEKVVVLGSDRSDFNATVVNRMENTSGVVAEDAKAFVFTAGYVINFTEEEAMALVKAYLNDATFVFIDPVFPDNDQLKRTIDSAIGKLLRQGYDVSGAEIFAGKMENMQEWYKANYYNKIEVLAFRKYSTYIIRDLEQMADLSDVSADGYLTSENNLTEEKNCADNQYEVTEYDHGESADLLVKWMMEADKDQPTIKSEASQTIDKYMTGHRTVVQQVVGPSRALSRALTYEMAYTVYSAYDFDNDKDYYFISLEPNFHCSALGCNTGSGSWVSANKEVIFDDGSTSGHWYSSRTDLWYGPYMSKFDFTGKIVTKEGSPVSGVDLLGATPKTDVSGSTGYTTGISYSLSGNVGFNSGGIMGGVTGGVSFSDSRTHTEKDLRVYHKEGNGITNWTIEGIVPQVHIGFFSYYHDEVATFQIKDWQTDFTWIVSVDKPQKDQPYYLQASDLTEITELNYNIYDYELRVHPTQSVMVQLYEPNRSRGGFIMSCSNNELQEMIKSQFSQTWQNEFTYYAQTNADVDDGASDMFEKVKVAVEGYKNQLLAKGFTGTYTFYLNRVDGTPMSSFTLENGEVIE